MRTRRRPLVHPTKDEGRLAAALVPGSQRWIGRGASCLAAHRKAEDDRRRGMRVPYARLWRFPCGSREHASTRWYLHCRYCWNLSRPDHLLSAVAQMYTEPSGRRQARTASAVATSAPGARIRTTLRCGGVPPACDARTQGGRIAARFGRPRTTQRAVRRRDPEARGGLISIRVLAPRRRPCRRRAREPGTYRRLCTRGASAPGRSRCRTAHRGAGR